MFTLEDASRPESAYEDAEKQFNNVTLETRLNNRVLDLRVGFFSNPFPISAHEAR